MQALNICIQGLDEKKFRNGDITQYLKEILDKKIPVCLTFAPSRETYSKTNPLHNSEILELTKAILEDKGNVLGQQGFYSRCPNEHKIRDPWHENWCWKGGFHMGTQREIMERGRDKLIELIGVAPELYSPPNHYFDGVTFEVASEMKYKFFADKAMIPIKPYSFDSMLVIPQGELHRNRIKGRVALYIHYDQISDNEENYKKIIGNIKSMKELKPCAVSETHKMINRFLKYGYKNFRDVKRLVERLPK